MGPETLVFMIPIVAVLIGGMIAVAGIMTAHQRKMAELIRKDNNEPGVIDELRAMRGELAELRDRVNQQTLAIESKNGGEQQRSEPPDLPSHLSE